MAMWNDLQLRWLLGAIFALLASASLITAFLRRRPNADAATIRNLAQRVNSWWVMVAVLVTALALGPRGATALFGVCSFLALREFITLTPTHPADHRALFWAFFVFLPLQYVFIAYQWYGMFTLLIPVYAFTLLPMRIALAGAPERFLERSAKIQWGLLACVYFLSHVPALLMLPIPGYAGQNAKLLIFLLVVVQLSDVFQYVWGKTLGRTKIAPTISPNKTVAGFVGGVLTATACGAALHVITPFSAAQAALLALLIALAGFGGGLVMSAVKRDLHVKDFGDMIPGHGGILDRFDSICFAAPLFFHVVRYYWAD